MEERDLIPEIDPTLGLTDEQVQSRTPAGKPVYSGKSEKEIVLTHCFTFFNLIFVILAVMLIIGGSSPLNMGFLVVAVINTVIGIIQEICAKRAVERLTLVAERPVAVIRNGTRQEIFPEAIVKDDIAEFCLRRHPPRRRHLTQRGNVGGRVAAHRRGRRGDENPRR